MEGLGALALEEQEDVLVVYPEAGAPPGAGGAVPVVEAGLEQAPSGLVAPVKGQAEGGQGLGVAVGGIADDDGADAAFFGDAEECLSERGQVQGVRACRSVGDRRKAGW